VQLKRGSLLGNTPKAAGYQAPASGRGWGPHWAGWGPHLAEVGAHAWQVGAHTWQACAARACACKGFLSTFRGTSAGWTAWSPNKTWP